MCENNKKSRTEAKHIKSPSAIVTYKVWQETVFAHFVINKKSNNFITFMRADYNIDVWYEIQEIQNGSHVPRP